MYYVKRYNSEDETVTIEGVFDDIEVAQILANTLVAKEELLETSTCFFVVDSQEEETESFQTIYLEMVLETLKGNTNLDKDYFAEMIQEALRELNNEENNEK